MQLCHLLLQVCGSKAEASCVEKCGTVVAVMQGKVYNLKSVEGKVSIPKSIGITVSHLVKLFACPNSVIIPN